MDSGCAVQDYSPLANWVKESASYGRSWMKFYGAEESGPGINQSNYGGDPV